MGMVYYFAAPSFDDDTAKSDEPKIKLGEGEGQPGEAQDMTQTAALQVKTETFPISEHFLDPHAVTVVTL